MTNSPNAGAPDGIDGQSSAERSRHCRTCRGERAEGVISTAIAVLIVALLGIGLWKGFDVMMDSAADRTRAQVEQIGG
jgi:hypothetical protein